MSQCHFADQARGKHALVIVKVGHYCGRPLRVGPFYAVRLPTIFQRWRPHAPDAHMAITAASRDEVVRAATGWCPGDRCDRVGLGRVPIGGCCCPSSSAVTRCTGCGCWIQCEDRYRSPCCRKLDNLRAVCKTWAYDTTSARRTFTRPLITLATAMTSPQYLSLHHDKHHPPSA